MNLSRKDLWWLAAAVALAVLFSLLIRSQRSLGEDIGANPLALAVREDRSSPVEGDAAADLTLILFVDYRCPGCRTAHPAMKRAVATDGNVRIVYKDWPVFGATSERAAQVAIASDYQKLYPQVHDRLMTGPGRWRGCAPGGGRAIGRQLAAGSIRYPRPTTAGFESPG